MAKKTDPVIYTTKITPEMAADWLNHNVHNRGLRERHVDELKQAILRGEWVLNGDPIRFDKDGTLLDGQHRLWAIYLAEMPVESVVIENLAPETQITIDRGARRNLADTLKLQGHLSSTSLAAVINTKWKLDNDLIRTSRLPTIAQALALLADNPALPESVKVANFWHRRLMGSNGAIGCLHYEFAGRDSEAAHEFFAGVVEGANLDKADPRWVLRRNIETSHPGYLMLMAVIIKAWNAYVEGRQIERLMWRPVGLHAEPFPQISG